MIPHLVDHRLPDPAGPPAPIAGVDRVDYAGDELCIAREAADGVRCGDCGVTIFVQATDHTVPTRGLGEGAVYEDDSGL
jgi:hypothetical protein